MRGLELLAFLFKRRHRRFTSGRLLPQPGRFLRDPALDMATGYDPGVMIGMGRCSDGMYAIEQIGRASDGLKLALLPEFVGQGNDVQSVPDLDHGSEDRPVRFRVERLGGFDRLADFAQVSNPLLGVYED
ncbi:MAG: hypothetical protein PHF00_10280 [Elusimicrobia bacterium]|nr:hypothetical protein [Elusimicrobiota bacterium]